MILQPTLKDDAAFVTMNSRRLMRRGSLEASGPCLAWSPSFSCTPELRRIVSNSDGCTVPDSWNMSPSVDATMRAVLAGRAPPGVLGLREDFVEFFLDEPLPLPFLRCRESSKSGGRGAPAKHVE